MLRIWKHYLNKAGFVKERLAFRYARMITLTPTLSRLRGRVGVRVLIQWHNQFKKFTIL